MAEIVVIGGGVSGLAAGIYAQRNGHHATICEKYRIAGGNLTAWKRQGYTIDTCIHWLTGTNPASPMYTMWEQLGALGEGVEIYRPEMLFTVEYEGERLSLYRDLEKTIADMLAISPQDKKEIQRFKKVVLLLMGFLGNAGPAFNEKPPLWKQIPYMPAIARYYFKTTGEVADRFRHPLLQKFMYSLLGREFAAIDFAFVTATFVSGNADLPSQISAPMAKRMADHFKMLGGELRTGAEVTGISLMPCDAPADRKLRRTSKDWHRATEVCLADGSQLPADYVVCAVDPKITFEKFLPGRMPKTLMKQYAHPGYKIFSSYHVQLSCDLPAEQIPFRENLFVNAPSKVRPTIGAGYFTLREFSHEVTFAKEGTATLQAMVYIYESGIRRFLQLYEDKEAYRKEKEKKGQAILTAIETRFPELSGKLHVLDVWTPATFRRYTGAVDGTYMAHLNPKRTYPHKLDAHIPGLTNVLLASQWTMAPGGLPVAASTGRAAIKAIDGVIR